MMYRLRDDGFPYLKIMRGGKCVGRVFKANGEWVCAIGGRVVATGLSAREAFGTGVARHLGHDSEESLRAQNRTVAHANRAARARGRALAGAMLSRDPAVRNAAFDQLFTTLFNKQEKSS